MPSNATLSLVMEQKERILVIKLGALGDLIQSMGPFAAIRAHHRSALMVLLTRELYAGFMRQSPYFDAVWVDTGPRVWQVCHLLSLRARLRRGQFTKVYDLQTSNRSSYYFWLMGRPPWSGIAPGCIDLHINPARDRLHTLDRQAEQLAIASIPVTPAPDLSWVQVDSTRLRVQSPFVLLVAGSATHRPGKRWPAECYAALAIRLVQRGCTPVLVGTSQDRPQIETVMAVCPQAVDLSEQTSFADLVGLGRNAAAAVGNDTGPMHLLAVSGCLCVVLYGPASDPSLCAPRGARVTLLYHTNLAELAVAIVEAALADS